MTRNNPDGTTASDVLAVLAAAEAGGAERDAAVADWPELAEAAYQTYAQRRAPAAGSFGLRTNS